MLDIKYLLNLAEKEFETCDLVQIRFLLCSRAGISGFLEKFTGITVRVGDTKTKKNKRTAGRKDL